MNLSEQEQEQGQRRLDALLHQYLNSSLSTPMPFDLPRLLVQMFTGSGAPSVAEVTRMADVLNAVLRENFPEAEDEDEQEILAGTLDSTPMGLRRGPQPRPLFFDQVFRRSRTTREKLEESLEVMTSYRLQLKDVIFSEVISRERTPRPAPVGLELWLTWNHLLAMVEEEKLREFIDNFDEYWFSLDTCNPDIGYHGMPQLSYDAYDNIRLACFIDPMTRTFSD